MTDDRRFARADVLLVVCLVALAVVRGLFFIGMYPAFKIVDEPAQFDDVQFRAEHHLHAPRVPIGAVNQIEGAGASRESKDLWAATQHYWRGRFLRDHDDVPEEHALARLTSYPEARVTDGQSMAAHAPGFYYTLGAAVPYQLFRRANVLRRLFALRVYSLAWGVLFVVFTFCAARVALRDRVVAFSVALFAMLQPLVAQHTTSVGCDAALIALCALVLWAQLVVLTRDADAPGLRWWLLIAIGTALALETKQTAIAMIPGTLVLVARALAASPRHMARTVGVSAVVFAASWLVCHLVCDHVVASDTMVTGGGGLPRSLIPTDQGFLGFAWSLDRRFTDELASTGWSVFAWSDAKMSPEWVDDLHAGALVFWLSLPAAGALRWLFPHRPRFFVDRAIAFSALTTLCGLVTAVYAEYHARLDLHMKHGVQGKDLLLVLPAAACMGAAAIGSLVPRRFRTLACGLVCMGMALVATGAAVTVIGSLYVD